jgi:DNA-binding CsgD family transcriptional regulator
MTAWALPKQQDAVRSNYIRTEDARAIVRLSGEVRELSTAKQEPVPHLLRELGKITRSEVALEFTARFRRRETYQFSRVLDHGWRTASDRTRVFDYYLSLTLEEDPIVSEAMRRPSSVVTLMRSEIVSNRDWQRTVLFNEIYVPSAIEDSLLSVFKVNAEGDVRALIFKRATKGGAFGERERDLLDIFVSEHRWLFAGPRPTPTMTPNLIEKFSRREREVLEILLTGAPEKHVAGLLGVSRNTAHQYVKSIYRKLSVTSRPQLMAEMAAKIA